MINTEKAELYKDNLGRMVYMIPCPWKADCYIGVPRENWDKREVLGRPARYFADGRCLNDKTRIVDIW